MSRTPLTGNTSATLAGNLAKAVAGSGLSEEEASDWNGRLRELHVGVHKVLRHEQTPVLTNPYHTVPPTRNYREGWQPLGWQEQLKRLQAAFSDLDLSDEGLKDMAEGYTSVIANSPPLEREGYDKSCPLWDGLLVYALPGRVARKKWDVDLWEDIDKDVEGEGYWGRLCEEVLFPQFTQPEQSEAASCYNGFYNYRTGRMASDRFLPDEPLREWLELQEARIAGDFACRPCNFGRRLAGYSVEAQRWEVEKRQRAILGCSWIVGCYLVADPDFLTPESLWLDAGGDKFRYEESRRFGDAPCFYRDASELYFSSYHIGHACSSDGGVLLSR